ncbi:MAG: nucleotidyl-sugar pyranose mutase [Sphingobacteriales bacterium]|nr:nucleotidyl-sugar pyranose mutase [Sphingobacteriales bacterium]
MKIGILGAGVSGLSIGKLLKEEHQIEILERKSFYGGIARTKTVNNISYHMIGGHCFNSKHKDVMDFVFNQILPENQWHKVTRDAVIRFKGHEVSYPIEFAIQEIFSFDSALALNITKDFLNAKDDNNYKNLEDWFRKKFGDTLSDEYFIPYNTKIWNKNPSEMNPSWVEGKLPIPDKMSFFEGLLETSKDKMPHSEFYYPNSNNQNTFIDNLASDLDITVNCEIEDVFYNKKTKQWIINNELSYDLIISTLPLNLLPKLIKDCPSEVLEAALKLKYNKVSNMLWETLPTTKTWTYIPESDNFFHRYIHIGNFFEPKQNYTITEVIGERSFEEMLQNGSKDPFLIKPVDYNISDHAYVVFDENYYKSMIILKRYLKEIGIYSLGRFGEWEYYNMDVCIKKSIELAKALTNNCTDSSVL